jgi:competence protein ComEC
MHVSQQVRRPLVGVSLSVVAGLFLQQSLHAGAALLLALAAFALSFLCLKPSGRPSAAVYAACLLLAAAYGAVEQTLTPARAAEAAAEDEFQRREMVGTVLDDPVFSEEDRAATFRFRLEAVRFEQDWRPADAVIRVRVKSAEPLAAYGERWRITGRCRSYEKAYGGMAGACYVSSGHAARVRPARPSFRGFCYDLRRRARPVFEKGMGSFGEQARLVQALLLGYRDMLPAPLYRDFARTGMFHIFAISGLHVGVMAAILIAGLKMAGVAKPNWGWFLIPLLFFYVVSTGMKPSAFRAFVMAAVYFAAPLVHRRPDSPTAIALAAIILLLVNPLQLSDPGFLLSFTVVCGIVMVHAYGVRRFRGFDRPRWTQISGSHPLQSVGRSVGLLLLTSVAAWIFSAPLSARFFNTLSPVAVPGNLVMIPFAFLIVLTGCLSLLAAPCLPVLTVVFNHANRVFVSILIETARRLGSLPGAYCYVRSPSGWMMAGWYAGLALFFCGPKRWRRPGLLLVLGSGLIWAVARPVSASDQISVSVKENFTVFGTSGGWVVAAAGDSYSLSQSTRWLKANGINRVRDLAVTGAEVDADMLRDLCRTFSVGRLWMPSSMSRPPDLTEQTRRGLQVHSAGPGRWPAGAGYVTIDLGY